MVISSTDESFVWRGNQGPGSIGDDQDLSDNESQLSGSALVDSCLWVGNSFWALKSTEHCPLHERTWENVCYFNKKFAPARQIQNQLYHHKLENHVDENQQQET